MIVWCIQSKWTTLPVRAEVHVLRQKALFQHLKLLWWLEKRSITFDGTSLSAVHDTSLKSYLCRIPYAETSFSFSVRLLRPYILLRIIVSINMQTSSSFVDAPWAEVMCKIAFYFLKHAGWGVEEASRNRHITSCTGRLFKWKISIFQLRSRTRWILFCPGSCSDYWAEAQTHKYSLKNNTQTDKKEPKAQLQYY